MCKGLFRDNPSISDVIFIVKEHYTQKSAKKKKKHRENLPSTASHSLFVVACTTKSPRGCCHLRIAQTMQAEASRRTKRVDKIRGHCNVMQCVQSCTIYAESRAVRDDFPQGL